MASKPYTKEMVPLGPCTGELSEGEDHALEQQPESNLVNVKFLSRPRRKVMIIVAVTVVVVIVIGVLVGTIVPNYKSYDDENDQSEKSLQGKDEGEQEESIHSTLPGLATNTQLSPSASVFSTLTHQPQITASAHLTDQLKVSTTSTCSYCKSGDIDAHSTTLSPLSSIRQLVPNTEAKWSRWSLWSDCTKTCGNGTRFRTRTCVAQNQRAVFAPISCAGIPQQTKTCSQWSCPDCRKTCVKGTLNAACDACTCDNHTLTGRVQTKSDAPISGADVASSETPYNVLAQTDEKGFFKAVNVCADANHVLLITRKGFVPVKLKATVLTSTTADVKAQLETAVPPSVTVHPQSKMRISGDSVTFCCDGEGNPPPEFEWFKDNNIIDKAIYHNDKNLEISNVSGLTGKYRCRVVNDFGSEFSNVADLKVYNTSEAASCNPTPTSKNATLPAGCVIHGTTSNSVDVGECKPAPCLRNDSAFSNKTCEDKKFCCTVAEVTDVTVSCGSSVTFSVPKVARCGCQECEEPKSQITGVVVGRKGVTEKPIAYCDLKFEDSLYRADDNGFFSFEVYNGKQRLPVVFKDSYDDEYADLTKVFRIEKGQTLFSKVILKPKPAPRPFNSSEDFKVQLGDSGDDSAFAEMELPKDALLKDDGTIFSGQANLRLNVMNPRNLSDILTAPADFSTIDEDGEEQMLVSYGMLSFDFEDDSGNKLSPSKPIKLYLDPEKLNISVDNNGNTTTKLWWLDAKTGRWIEAGDLWVEQKASNRSRRAPTRFVLETEITPAVSRQGTFNIDVRENFGAVRVTASVGSTIRILCEDPNSNPRTYTGYLEGTVNSLQVTCISVWINRRCFMQGESANSRFLQPSPPDNFPQSVSATIVSNQNLQGSSSVQSFRFEVRTRSQGPVFPHFDNDVQQCRAPSLTPGLQQFEFQDPGATRLNLASNRIDNMRDPLNWYPSNVNCFIKLLLHGNAAMFLASSHKQNQGAKFGDSVAMAEPATDRDNVFVTCLEIRCPGLVYQPSTRRQVPEWTHVLVTHLTGTCDFQRHHLRKQDDIDNSGTQCPTRSKRHSPGSETWLCIPLPNSGFDIDNVYTADRSRPGLGESRCKNGNIRWQQGMTDTTNTAGPTAEFSCS